jgi:surface antigen
MVMRSIVLLSLLLAGCVGTGSPNSYDPRLYDANGNVVTAAVAPPAEPRCREIQQTVTIGGTPQAATSTACRQPDGTWRITN